MRRRDVLHQVLKGIETYFIPLGLLGISIQLWEDLPPLALAAIITVMIIYMARIVFRAWRRERSQLSRLTFYENLINLDKYDGKVSDPGFRYDKACRAVIISDPDAQIFVEEEGVGIADLPQDRAVRLIVGDSRADFDKLNVQAWVDVGKGLNPATVTGEERDNGRAYVITITFRGAVVRKDCRFKVVWQYTWPGAVARNVDYWIYPVTHYVHPLNRLIADAYFTAEPVDCSCCSLDDAGIRPVELTGPNDVKAPDGVRRLRYRADVSNPAHHCVISWRLRP